MQSGFDYKLYKIDKLVAKINQLEFSKEYTLNYYLFDFLLGNAGHELLKESVFEKLKDESSISIQFIDGFLDFTKYQSIFISQLVGKWTGIWSFLKNKSNFTEERIALYFRYIIEYAELEDIKKLYTDKAFKQYLIQNTDFLAVSADLEKIKTIIKGLNVKFVEVNLDNVPIELVNFIYEGDYYEINEVMVRSIMKAKDQLKDTDFELRNYFAITNSTCDKLKRYLQANINDYIQSVYLVLEDNTKEEQNSLIELINNENLTVENKSELIQKVDTLINDLSLIEDLETSKILLENIKISPTWENIIHYYKANQDMISDSIINFLESKNSASELSKIKIKKDIEGERTYTDFILNLIKTDKLQDKAYESVLKSIPYNFTSFDLNVLSKTKVEFTDTKWHTYI